MQGTQLISGSEWQDTQTGVHELQVSMKTRPGEEGQKIGEDLSGHLRSFCARNLISSSYDNNIWSILGDS